MPRSGSVMIVTATKAHSQAQPGTHAATSTRKPRPHTQAKRWAYRWNRSSSSGRRDAEGCHGVSTFSHGRGELILHRCGGSTCSCSDFCRVDAQVWQLSYGTINGGAQGFRHLTKRRQRVRDSLRQRFSKLLRSPRVSCNRRIQTGQSCMLPTMSARTTPKPETNLELLQRCTVAVCAEERHRGLQRGLHIRHGITNRGHGTTTLGWWRRLIATAGEEAPQLQHKPHAAHIHHQSRCSRCEHAWWWSNGSSHTFAMVVDEIAAPCRTASLQASTSWAARWLDASNAACAPAPAAWRASRAPFTAPSNCTRQHNTMSTWSLGATQQQPSAPAP